MARDAVWKVYPEAVLCPDKDYAVFTIKAGRSVLGSGNKISAAWIAAERTVQAWAKGLS